MLYEVIATVRPHSIAEVKDIARSAGNLILQNGGVVRGFTNWGVFALPKPLQNISQTRSSAAASNAPKDPYSAQLSNKHTVGHYFIMRFDSNARTQHTLRKTWASDPRLLRFSVVKMGNKLSEIADVGGKAEEWTHAPGAEGSVGISPGEGRQSALTNALSELGGTTMGRGQFHFPGVRDATSSAGKIR